MGVGIGHSDMGHMSDMAPLTTRLPSGLHWAQDRIVNGVQTFRGMSDGLDMGMSVGMGGGAPWK